MEKLNIAELLKDCPEGMELDCTMFDKVILLRVDSSEGRIYPIIALREDGCPITLTKYGQYSNADSAKCVIFPKDKTTWEGFQRPFKDGDVVVCKDGKITQMFILKFQVNDNRGYCYTGYDFHINRFFEKGYWDFHRLATKEEKERLFKAIKANGYKWNPETKTLEKLIETKFKVGDVIQDIDTYKVKITEVNIEDECYGYESMIAKGIGSIGFSEQDNWKLVPNKFDITTLKPFESRVLVRDFNNGTWRPAIFGAVVPKTLPFVVVGGCFYGQCIPYESNQHLLGTTNDCDEYYKTWE